MERRYGRLELSIRTHRMYGDYTMTMLWRVVPFEERTNPYMIIKPDVWHIHPCDGHHALYLRPQFLSYDDGTTVHRYEHDASKYATEEESIAAWSRQMSTHVTGRFTLRMEGCAGEGMYVHDARLSPLP